jgi:hypothetical protein
LFVTAILWVLVSTETANFPGRVECKEVDVLIGSDNDSLARVHENLILGIGEAGDLDKTLIHNYFCISHPIHGHTEFGAANRDRCGGTVDSVGIWLPTEMVDFYPDAAQQDFEQLAKRIGRPKIFQEDPRARTDHHETAVGEFDREVATASRINFFSGEDHIAPLRGCRPLDIAG